MCLLLSGMENLDCKRSRHPEKNCMQHKLGKLRIQDLLYSRLQEFENTNSNLKILDDARKFQAHTPIVKP